VDLAQLPLLSGARPFIGHNAEFQYHRHSFFERVKDHPDPVIRLKGVAGTIALVNDPEALGEVLVDKARSFVKARLVRWVLYPLAGDGLFTSDGDLWRRQRKLMAPLFHRGQLDRYGADMIACAERTMAGWQPGQVVELAPAMTRLTMGVAGKTLFDADTFSEADEIGDALTVALDWSGRNGGSMFGIAHVVLSARLRQAAERLPERAGKLLGRASRRLETPLFLPGRDGQKMHAALDLLDSRVARMIDERRRGTARDDLLSRLLDATGDDGARMDDKQLRDEILTLFVAGHETTATGLAWTFQLLCQHPDWYRRVQAEVDALPGPPTVRDLPRLGLCLRVFKEALRLYPPVYFFARTAIEPVDIAGVTLPAECFVMISPYALHHRARVWPEPERFDPDRFLPDAEAARSRHAWLPFGAGPRVCIGNHFAMMEAPLVMATLMRAFRFEPLEAATPVFSSAALRPSGPMRMRLHARA
jgi:cytochrome P450